ncbi:uncharacterized protein LOC134272301 [Saccostrea cucullata]|uniref:uncharacterized protein LOC134272301 n=1 Tax=Saccostrea cuccullata TaxID=36930 RepID=UPI002ED67E23
MTEAVSELLSSQNSLTDTERILVIALLSALSIIIICLITLIVLTCRNNMKADSGAHNKSVSRRSIGKPVLTGRNVRLSVSRLNSRYSDGNFAAKRDSFINRSVRTNPVYFENQTFQSNSPRESELYSLPSGSGSDAVFTLHNETPPDSEHNFQQNSNFFY